MKSRLAVTVAVVLLCPAAALPELDRADAEEVAVFESREGMEAFLRRARVGRLERLEVGVTRSCRSTLTYGGVSHDAHIQTVDRALEKGSQLSDHSDYFGYNVAAYRLDKLLGLGMVPASVERSVKGERSAVTWWVDNVRMTEAERRYRQVAPADIVSLERQMQQVRVFSQLIFDEDRNLSNLLIDADWKIWMIDFTRAFRSYPRLRNPAELVGIGRGFYDALQGLTQEALRRELGSYLSKPQIRGLLARRDLLVEYFDQLSQRRGAAAVFYDD